MLEEAVTTEDAQESVEKEDEVQADEEAIPEEEMAPSGRIVFCSERDGNYEIYVMDADGSNQTRLANNDDIDASPDWSS